MMRPQPLICVSDPSIPNQWLSAEHALEYLARANSIPHRVEGEAALLEEINENSQRLLDLGTGDGRLMSLVLLKCPQATGGSSRLITNNAGAIAGAISRRRAGRGCRA
jgi:hypothetical protein